MQSEWISQILQDMAVVGHEATRVAKPSSVVVADRAVTNRQHPAINNAATAGVAGVATNTALSNR